MRHHRCRKPVTLAEKKKDKTIISVQSAKIKILQKYSVVPLRMSEVLLTKN